MTSMISSTLSPWPGSVLRNMKKSVMSAAGSFEISGASRWLAALADDGPGPRRSISSASAAPTSASPITATLRLPRTANIWLPPSSLWGHSFDGPHSPAGEDRFDLRPDEGARLAHERVAERRRRGDQRPVAGGTHELDRGLDLRAHRARRKLRQERFGLVGRELAQLTLRVGAEAGIHRRHLGEDDEPVGAEVAREQGGGPVLVDHRIDARQVLATPRGGDAAAA